MNAIEVLNGHCELSNISEETAFVLCAKFFDYLAQKSHNVNFLINFHQDVLCHISKELGKLVEWSKTLNFARYEATSCEDILDVISSKTGMTDYEAIELVCDIIDSKKLEDEFDGYLSSRENIHLEAKRTFTSDRENFCPRKNLRWEYNQKPLNVMELLECEAAINKLPTKYVAYVRGSKHVSEAEGKVIYVYAEDKKGKLWGEGYSPAKSEILL